MEELLKIMRPMGLVIRLKLQETEMRVASQGLISGLQVEMFDYIDVLAMKDCVLLLKKFSFFGSKAPIVPFLTLKDLTQDEILLAVKNSANKISILDTQTIFMAFDEFKKKPDKIFFKGFSHTFLTHPKFGKCDGSELVDVSIEYDSQGFSGLQMRFFPFNKEQKLVPKNTVFYFAQWFN